MSEIFVPISVGELVDKITILEIKSEKLKDAAALANVRRELELLEAALEKSGVAFDDLSKLRGSLREINLELWGIEDRIRDKEMQQAFDARFIELARAVYVTNDRRARVKRDINLQSGSALVEEKSYADYQ